MKLFLFLALVWLPNIRCNFENIVPAVIEDISETSLMQRNHKATFKDDTEDLEKYVNRSKDLGHNGDAATMDSYIAAYRLYHEEYQNIEEKKNDEIAKYNYDENTKNRRIRSVDDQTPDASSSLIAAPLQPPTMVKFELSDAKTLETPKQHEHQQKSGESNRNFRQPYKNAPAAADVNKAPVSSDQSLVFHGNRDVISKHQQKQQRGSRDKKSTEELRMIQITHPVPTSYQTRGNRPLLDRLPAGLQKMIDIVVGGGSPKKGTKSAVLTIDGKGLYKGTSNQRYATGTAGTGNKNSLPNVFPSQHTSNNPAYNSFNNYQKQLSDYPNKQWWSNSENNRQNQAPMRPFQTTPHFVQYSFNEPKQVNGSPVPNLYVKPTPQPYTYELHESQPQQQQAHYKYESLPVPQALQQSQQFQYQPQDTIQHHHQNEFKPEAYSQIENFQLKQETQQQHPEVFQQKQPAFLKQVETYQQLSDSYQKPQVAFLHQQPQKTSEIYQQIQQQQQQQQHQQQPHPTKPHSDAQEQQFIFGDYSFIPYSPIDIPISDGKIEGGKNTISSTPAPIHENTEKTAEQLDNERQIPSVAALAALIGQNPSSQLKGLSDLLKQEQVVPQSGRPQDSTAPILFHPNGIPPRQQPPATAITIPKNQPAPKVISYEDFVKFYGKEKAHILLSENHQFEPAQNNEQEYITPAPLVATTVQPKIAVNHQNANHNINPVKYQHTPLNNQHRPLVHPTSLPPPKTVKYNQHAPVGHKSVTILNSPKPHFDQPKPITYKPKQHYEGHKPITSYQPDHKAQKPEKPQSKEHKSEYDGNSEDDLQYAAEYEFGYRVRDFNSGNDFGHQQNRDNDGVTRGEYHILLPDGRIQSVKYTADDAGFHADVSYESVD